MKLPRYLCKVCQKERAHVRLIPLMATVDGKVQTALILVCLACARTGRVTLPVEDVFPHATAVELLR